MNPQDFLPALGRISVQASVLVLLVLLAQGIFRQQLTARWRCALWMLVIVRLLLPFSPGSAASIFNLMPPLANHTAHPAPITFAPATAAPAPLPVLADPTLETPLLATQPAQPPENGRALTPVPEPTQAPRSLPYTSATPTAVKLPPVTSTSWLAVLFWVWLAGALLLTGYIVATSLRLAWRCRRLPAHTDATTLAALDECGRRLGVRGRLTVVECAEVASPALFGLFRPRLLLPPGFTQSFSPEELRFVFLHELAHLRRWDLPLNWLVAVLQILHWFNPLVWFGFARWRWDRELACDALAIEAAGADQHRAYGRTILHLLENLTPRAPLPGLVGILEDKRQLRRRIGMIANFRPGNRWGLPSAALLLLLALVGLTDAQSPKSKSEPPAAPTLSALATNDQREVRIGADPPLTEPATNSESRTLIVTVLDAATDQPLEGAEVSVPILEFSAKSQPRRLTDANGKYELRFALPPKADRSRMNNFTLSAKKELFVKRSVQWTASRGDIFASVSGPVSLKLERGVTIGGEVRDERGAPLPDVKVLLSGSGARGFPMGGDERAIYDYAEIRSADTESQPIISDSAGRWRYAHFPSDLENVEVIFVRPDDSRVAFSTIGIAPFRRRPVISLVELRNQTAVVKLSEGVTVHGLVTDENGKPLEGVTVKEGYGYGNIVRVGEFKTSAGGRFERAHRAPRQWIYTAERTGRATVSVVAQVEVGMSEVRLVMPPARPQRIEAVDGDGKPLPNAEISILAHRTEGQILDWKATTDANGVAVWTNAPTAPVTLKVASKSSTAWRQFKIAPTESGRRVVLKTPATGKLTLRIKAVDAATRSPVKVSAVSVQHNSDVKFKKLAEPGTPEFSIELSESEVSAGMYASYQLLLEADGYESLTTDSYDFAEGDQELVFAFKAGGRVGDLLVLQPDDHPAVGARLWARTTRDAGSLFINGPDSYYGDRLAQASADENGRIKIPGAPADAPIVFTHANGFLETTPAALRGKTEVRLKPYGSVEGRVLVAGKPKVGVDVILATLTFTPSAGTHVIRTYTSGPDGQFAFTQVPEGAYKLCRGISDRAGRGMSRAITETYQQPVSIRAGETTKVEYYTPGRRIVGHAVPGKPGVALYWQMDTHVLNLKLTGDRAVGRPDFEDFATHEALRKANDASLVQQSTQGARAYPLLFEADGSFHADDVPPGTYELRIRVTKPGGTPRFTPFDDGEEIGVLVREVVVPEGMEPLDLGTLTVAVKVDAGVKPSVGIDFAAPTLDGTSFRLADQRGKFVVLIFWASGSQRSREVLADLKKLEVELPPGARVEFVGANLDDDPATARAAVQSGGWPWTQTHLDQGTRPKLTAAWDVKELPAIFLLNGEARVLARDLDAERLRLALHRASVMR